MPVHSLSPIESAERRPVDRSAPILGHRRVDRLAVSVDDTAGMLGVAPLTIRRMIRDGKLPRIKVGSRTVIPIAAIDRLLNGEAVDA
jgi:excisionase family DNA binding protein